MDEDDNAAERRHAEAAQWFARLKTLPVSHGTLRDFFAWRRHKQNADAFEEAERFWNESDKLAERPAILRAVEAAEARRVVPRARRPFVLIPVLAVMVVALVTGAVYVIGNRSTIRTAAGELRVIALDDGSRVQLNTETQLKVRYRAESRNLALQNGEALFRVAHDAGRPFIVTAGDVTVTATGTQFDVSRFDGKIAVTLMQGRVIVRAPDGTALTLKPGEQWRWPREGAASRNVNASNIVAWTQGRIVFDNTALSDAIATVNRYGGHPVTLDAPAMGAARISGTFEAGDPQAFAAAVTAFLPLRQRKDQEGRIHLVSGE